MKKTVIHKVILLAAALTALFSGCRVEEPLSDPNSARTVAVRIGMRAAIGEGIAGGITLSTIRIIAVDGSGRVVFNRYRNETSGTLAFDDRDYGDPVTGNYIVDLFPGTYDIYVVVNEPRGSQSDVLNSLKTSSDLEAIRLSPTELSAMTEATMTCVGRATGVRVRDVENEWVCADGIDWSGRLNVDIERVAAKLTVRVRKNSADEDTFSITRAVLSHLPEYTFLLPQQVYDGDAFSEKEVPLLTENRNFDSDSEVYTPVLEAYIVPEYLMTDPADNTGAVRLVLTADYTAGGDVFKDVQYSMPLLGNGVSRENGTKSYEMVRNKHYFVNITISARGEFEYAPYIEYRVVDWDTVAEDPANVDITETFTATGDWAPDTRFEAGSGDNTVLVDFNGTVTMNFSLSFPNTAQWRAYLTNDSAFGFDLEKGVSGGVARGGSVYRIVVYPLRETNDEDVATELFILLDNGTKQVEYDLNGRHGRYVIKQIPN